MQTLNPRTWKWDWAALPPAVQLALLSPTAISQIRRLTPDTYALRIESGMGVWVIGSLDELTILLSELPIPIPYSPPVRPSAEPDPLDLSALNITLDF